MQKGLSVNYLKSESSIPKCRPQYRTKLRLLLSIPSSIVSSVSIINNFQIIIKIDISVACFYLMVKALSNAVFTSNVKC